MQTFVDRYQKKHDTRITVAPLEWCGEAEIVLDPRDPVTQKFTTAVVESFIEALGTDHLYGIWLPTEETSVEDDPERAAELPHASVDQMISAIKAGDPDAFVFSPRVCTDNPTGKAQAMAVREAGLPVVGNMFLNHNGRMYDFLRTDYYWGLPWTTGMCGQRGRETNPNGDINAAVMNARMLADHPKASNLVGFMVSTETNHRNVMTMWTFTLNCPGTRPRSIQMNTAGVGIKDDMAMPLLPYGLLQNCLPTPLFHILIHVPTTAPYIGTGTVPVWLG